PTWFKPKDEKQVATSAFFAGAIAVFDKQWHGPANAYIERDRLYAQGEAFMAQIRKEAAKLAPQQQPTIPETTNTVWPAEVNFLFDQVPTAAVLSAHLQHKLRSHINRLKLEGIPDNTIITTAEALTAAMGAAA
ncbi:phage N-6-adenine-methyltransferase, partial [Candidatus Symbiopectobacterium sp. NZEC135]|nr:phage N-6-adenine-methyltransferase [Candidatus Symbiopectobacterium sp. NZEC135]